MKAYAEYFAVWFSVFIAANASAAVLYVDLNSANSTSPYADWSTAATNIQDAIDASTDGDLILVTNGLYTTGGRVVYGALTNRVVISKPVTVQSVDGPSATTITGSSGIRCVYITNGAMLAGFTLTNGSASTSGDSIREQSGGGIWCESFSATISNCVIVGNTAQNYYGGGAFGGTLINCLLTNNSARDGGGACSNLLLNCTIIKNSVTIMPGAGGGVIYSTLSNCLVAANAAGAGGSIGGGAAFSLLMTCVVSNNSAYEGGGVCSGVANNSLISSNMAAYGGGAYSNVLNTCMLKNNLALLSGGGADACALVNCTVVSNTAATIGYPPYAYGGGISRGSATNCVIYYNSASWLPPNYYLPGNVSYCCTTPDTGLGVGNITNDPAFLNLSGGDFHLQTNSPCINSGNNAYVSGTNDLDGNPRIAGGTVDIGAYEYQTPTSVISYAWLQQYGLPIDGSVDYADSDGDGMNNWQEWIAGTNPTNAASVLVLESPAVTVSNATITWGSVTNRIYYVQRGSDLSQPDFSSIQSNIIGQASMTSFTDTNAVGSGPFFYRVGVQ